MSRFKFLGICIFLLAGLMFASVEAKAATYYISPGGNDSSAGTSSAPWRTFAYSKSALRPGDTLILMDGVYKEYLLLDISGTSSAYITLKAMNDGKATVDGEGVRGTGRFVNANYINLEGIVFRNADYNGGDYLNDGLSFYNASHINIRRVSVYMGSPNFSLSSSSYILLEDCAARSGGRVLYNLLGCHHITVRRCWGYWENNQMPNAVGGPNAFMQVYGSNDCLVENCIGIKAPSVTEQVEGIAVFANTYNDTCDRNSFFGNMIIGMNYWAYAVSSFTHLINGNYFRNNAAIDNSYGFFQRADNYLIVKNLVVKGTPNQGFMVQADTQAKDSDWAVKGVLKDSVFTSGGTGLYVDASSQGFVSFTDMYNDFSALSQIFAGDAVAQTGTIYTAPSYDTTKYGRGAYLIYPANLKGLGENGENIGAEILYRYQNGTLTTTPLWPWPMESRIMQENGISPTWESSGGLWNTLEGVYSTLDSAPTSDPGTITPPPVPEPVSPGNGDKVPTSTQLKWQGSADPSITYSVKVCTDNNLKNCTTNTTVSKAGAVHYAGFGGSAAGLLLFGFAFMSGLRRKRKIALIAGSVLIISLLLMSCGGGGGGSSSGSGSVEMSYPVSGLSSNTTYYWQVTADNGKAKSDSQIMNFITE